MKYRPLPIETELKLLQERDGDEAMQKRREALFLETASTPGFGLVTGLLREYEAACLDSLRRNPEASHIERLIGGLNLIERLRTSLAALLPAAQQPSVDWFNDAEEEYTGHIERLAGRQE